METCSRPFSSVVEKSGDRPRIEITESRPSSRWEVTPGRRAIDSAMELSGSLPMSSAEMLSTIWSEVRFWAIALRSDERKPVTTTSLTEPPSSARCCVSVVGEPELGTWVVGTLVDGPFVVCAAGWDAARGPSASPARAGAVQASATRLAPANRRNAATRRREGFDIDVPPRPRL